MSHRDRKKRQSRRQWLQAGRACFARDGYDGSSVEQIADEAGLSRPGFFLYFPSKAALRRAIALECLQVWITMVGQEAERGGGHCDQLERSLQRMHCQLIEAAPLLMAVGVLTTTEAADDAPIVIAWERLMRAVLALGGQPAVPPLPCSAAMGLLQGAWKRLITGQAEEAEVRALLCDWLGRVCVEQG